MTHGWSSSGFAIARVAAVSLALCLGILGSAGSGLAEKVGVAAAVNPDAFSSLSGTPSHQLNIGKSIFYNERIKLKER